MKILGISCFYHDSAACLLIDGRIVAAAQEERFTRKKHDEGFPLNAVRYCLKEGKIFDGHLDAVVFYEKPILKFHRILETFFSVAPKGLKTFLQAVPLWVKDRLFMSVHMRESLEKCGIKSIGKFYFVPHHESHAASAFYPSPFPEAAILTLDGVGEWSTATIGVGEKSKLKLIKEMKFPHSLGLLYSAFTYFTGFRVNSGEYKLMGLAPYGKPTYVDKIKKHIVQIFEDGSIKMNMDYFGYINSQVMTNQKFADLFDGPARKPESPVTQREMDMARSIQEITEEIVLKMARYAKKITGKDYACLAGGVALNCVANGRLLREGIFKDIWIQPASGDAGGALGAALVVWHNILDNTRNVDGKCDLMQGAYLGPKFEDSEIKHYLDSKGYIYTQISSEKWADRVADLIASENVVGLVNGRMEFGPRALGNRSIIGDARSPKMQSIMNLKIKYRESFRPFAPSCLEEDIGELFDLDRPSPYMLLVAQVKKERCISRKGDEDSLDVYEWVNRPRSDIPAITHVDYSARVQSVNKNINPDYHNIISSFKKKTGYGVIINTSFNVRGEPIVCSPEDAYRCFMRTEMDYLVLGSFLLKKHDQPRWQDKENWKEEFKLD